jgi:MtN3 and saliva related transmembrane protein
MATQILGWSSSLVLVLTIAAQIWKQWREVATEGISIWLFLGQTAASTGFTAYSVLTKDWVFVVTNSLLLVSGLLGYAVLMRNRKREAESGSP